MKIASHFYEVGAILGAFLKQLGNLINYFCHVLSLSFKTRPYEGIRGIVDLGTIWRWVVSLAPLSPNPQVKSLPSRCSLSNE